MTGKAFWVAVDSLGGVARRRSVRVLIEDLAGLPAADIVGFADGLAWAVHALDTRRHAEHAAATASPGGASSTGMPSVDEFLLVRLAVVAAGEQVWRAVAADPARMSGIWATHEAAALLSAAAEAYERSTGARWDHQDPVGVATGSNRPAWDDAPAPVRDAWWNWLMVGGGWDIGVKDRPAFSLVRYELRRGLDQDPAWRAWWGYAPAPDLELFPFYSLKDPEPSKVRRGRKAVSVQADFDGEVVTRTPDAELPELVLQHLTVMLDLVREKLKLPAFPPFPEPLPDPMTPDEWRRQRREQAMAERAAAREQHDAPDPAASDPAPLSDADVPSDDRDGHTRYVAHFAHAIYWDDADDAAPFGSDEGADLWAAWQDRAEDLIPDGTVRTVLAEGGDVEDLVRQAESAPAPDLDGFIIGAAFTLMRLTGTLDPEGHRWVLEALDRRGHHPATAPEITELMRRDNLGLTRCGGQGWCGGQAMWAGARVAVAS
ncbi:MAG: DUF4240 domain-containing protein [Kineosporiaceae bacterium]